ncbi:hypothetical protein IB237_18640 [Agrobacterium sp. AGB01]|uniref:hypothetical protein n=1 Tax=Agrobacterium sp. AGB01 TaxID=2769302 RepID=UPI0017858D20|nr:hypothetical protein [Agrobacterium sp. AGB01]MBD9389208.1 hypothetical protein [Agrobacterium sp. AGB01]
MLKTTFMIVLATLAASPASAISRYETPSMNCAAVQSAIDREGAVILRYPSTRVRHMTLYDRYVSSARQCEIGEYAARNSVPTRDVQNCPVYRCEDRCNQFSLNRDC